MCRMFNMARSRIAKGSGDFEARRMLWNVLHLGMAWRILPAQG